MLKVRTLVKDNKSSAKPENIGRFYDVTYKYKSICSRQSVGYYLLGSDFKTLEYPAKNISYSVRNPGWLNDNIIDPYLLVCVRVHALNSFFFSQLGKAVTEEKDEKKLYDIILKSQGMVDGGV